MPVIHTSRPSYDALSLPQPAHPPFLLTLEVRDSSRHVRTYQYESADLSPSTAAEVEQQFERAYAALNARQFCASDYRGQEEHRIIFERAGGTRSFTFPLSEASVPGFYDLVQGIKARGRRL